VGAPAAAAARAGVLGWHEPPCGSGARVWPHERIGRETERHAVYREGKRAAS
jgi:hypothetical protein